MTKKKGRKVSEEKLKDRQKMQTKKRDKKET